MPPALDPGAHAQQPTVVTASSLLRIRPGSGVRIGRSNDNDLTPDDARVSRSHARLVVRAAGVVAHHLGSVSGGLPVGARTPSPR
ncbi:FHA domain-containing protein [Nocardia uniformis]|uniref:FHA domain-containing protein n=1 Tax=Nocardia uniformis TaxID=53432 RepID=A0A849BZV3_9NOCA|nr:FHA domain-containing protein [Nocardia uniformis]